MRRLPTHLILALHIIGGSCLVQGIARAEDTEFFEKNIRPVLVERCYECHSTQSGKAKGGLLVDTKQGLLKGGENGPVIVPGHPEQSRLIDAIRSTKPDARMPRKGERLTDEQIGNLTSWVAMGAPDPRVGNSDPLAGPYDYAAARKLWAFSKPKNPELPNVADAGWVKSPIDRFVLAKLEAAHLRPAPAADKRTLLRRATFDLTGLPPTPEEVDAFAADNSPDAFAKVIDRLLASPAYGERWARHWLDVVRYTDSFDTRGTGSEGDCSAAWRYRDWVVNAFNTDLPYNQFVKEQIAGDLLLKKETDDFGPLIATTMYVIGPWPGGDADRRKMITDIVDDQIDVTGRAFLGLTFGCARCHDHKFDPIPQADYYSLAGIFFSSHFMPGQGSPASGGPLVRTRMATPSQIEEMKQRDERIASLTKGLETEIQEQFTSYARSSLHEADRYIAAAWTLKQAAPGQKIEPFAQAQGLNARLLSRWVDYLGAYVRPANGNATKSIARTLLTRGPNRVPPVEGFLTLNCPDGRDCPNVAINRQPKQLDLGTVNLPARSVSIHPGPDSAVAVGWKSPVSGTVRIEGKVTDADAHCGDGIAWRVSRVGEAGNRDLAAGAYTDGGMQELIAGEGGSTLASVEVAVGDTIQLAVYPKQNYTCDSTATELRIIEVGGAKREWSLTRDMLETSAEPGASAIPHADLWSFYELPNVADPGTLQGVGLLARWVDERTAELNVSSGGPATTRPATAPLPTTAPFADPQILATAATVRDALLAVDADAAQIRLSGKEPAKELHGPDAGLYRDLTEPGRRFWSKNRDEAELPQASKDALKAIRSQIDELKAKQQTVPYCNPMVEGGVPDSTYAGIHDAKIHVRGRHDRQTEVVPRRFPRLLASDAQQPITQGSGRLQLAEWVAADENPLTARVMVNRLWQHHFGEGIVRTPNNYGKLGVPPTHPELLDWLAIEFVRGGWSIKSMQRTIMLSAAYQQSSEPDPQTLKADPDNLLWGHVNRQRLEAEAIRDSLLAVSGTLDRTMGGMPLREIDNPRRTLYLMTIRSVRADYRSLFDAADASGIAEKRIDSTVAPQALFLMNNEFVLAKAKALSDRLVKEAPADDRGRINWLYRQLYGRTPQDAEAEVGTKLLSEAKAVVKEQGAWQEYCQVLLCANEFVYVD